MAAFKKVFRDLVLLFFIIALYGCSLDRSGTHSKKGLNNLNDDELQEEYLETIESARDAFFSDISSVDDLVAKELNAVPATQDEIDGMDPEDLPVIDHEPDYSSYQFDEIPLKEQIEILAFQAAFTGNDEELVRLLKEHDLYDRFLTVNEEYSVEDIQNEIRRREGEDSERGAILFTRPPAQADDWLWELKTGDIVFSHNADTIYASLVPGYWDHCGILDTRGWGGRSDLRVLSASAVVESHGELRNHYGNPLYACSGYESIYFYSHQPHTAAVRVQSRFRPSLSRIQEGLDYVARFSGSPYVINHRKHTTDEWYCSKVAYQVYRKAGINIERPFIGIWKKDNGLYKINIYDAFVSPDDLYHSLHVDILDKYPNMPRPGAPGFSVGEGLYRNDFQVTLSAQKKAVIHYTLDGSEPTVDSAVYSAPLDIFEPTTLKAVAVNRQGEISPVAIAVYDFDKVAGEALLNLLSGNYNADQTVRVTPDANTTVHYTFSTDGSIPEDPTVSDDVCPGEFVLHAEAYTDILYRYKFRSFTTVPAARTNAEVSDVVSRRWRIDRIVPDAPACDIPAGTYAENFLVNLSGENGSDIRYTLDGSDPDIDSQLYSGNILIDKSCLLRAVTVDAAGNISPVAEFQYRLDTSFREIRVNLPSGRYGASQEVTVETSETAVVYYTFSADGTEPVDPDRSATVLTGSLTIGASPDEENTVVYKFRSYSTLLGPDAEGSDVVRRIWTVDRKAPEILSITPELNASSVDTAEDVIIVFSEAVDWKSVQELVQYDAFVYYEGELQFDSSLSADGKTLTLSPRRGEFYPAYEWSYTLAGDLKDDLGNVRTVSKTILFTAAIPEQSKGFTTVKGGDYCGYYIDDEGSLWGWGDNYYGQLGLGTTGRQLEPVLIRRYIQKVCSSGYSALYLTFDGQLFAAGRNNRGQLGDGSFADRRNLTPILDHITDMDSGYNFGMAVDEDNNLYAFGSNMKGQYGNGSALDDGISVPAARSTPAIVRTGVQNVSLGHNMALILDTEGNAYSSGANTDGVLGLGMDDSVLDQADTFRFVMDGITEIFSNNFSSICLTDEGELYAWGNNLNFKINQTHDYPVTSPEFVADGAVAAKIGNNGLAYLNNSGELVFSGDSGFYFLGGGSTRRVLLTNVRSFDLTGGCIYYETNSGNCYSRGENSSGQAGDGTTTNPRDDWYLLPF